MFTRIVIYDIWDIFFQLDTHSSPSHFVVSQAPKASKAAVGSERVMVKVPTADDEVASKKVKSLNAPVAASKVQLLNTVRHNDVTASHLCYECKRPMTEPDHYKWVLMELRIALVWWYSKLFLLAYLQG